MRRIKVNKVVLIEFKFIELVWKQEAYIYTYLVK